MSPEDLLDRVRALAQTAGTPAQRAARIASEVRDFGGHRWVGVYRVTSTEVVLLGYAGPGAPAYPTFPRTQGLTASAVATAGTVIADDVSTDPRYLTAFGSTRSEMIVPVVGTDGAVIGTIDIESEQVAAFGTAERDLVERCGEAIVSLYGPGRTPTAAPSPT